MPTRPEHTVGHVVDRWLTDMEQRVDLAPVTKQEYSRLMAHLLAWGQRRALACIDLRQYVTARREAGAAPRTLVLELRVIGTVFKWARDERLIPPTASLKLPRIKVDPLRFEHNHVTPSPSEAARAIEAMDNDDWRLAMLLIARTGARVGEVVNLRSRDLDEPGRRIAFGATDESSKTGMRWFPLDAASLQDLRGRGGRGNVSLFDFEGRGDPREALRHRLELACHKAGVTWFTPHGLRRMVVGRLIRARIDAGTAATLTGHSVHIMLRYYQVVTDDDRREAAERANLGVLVDPVRNTPADG